jgi:hypothetical protein
MSNDRFFKAMFVLLGVILGLAAVYYYRTYFDVYGKPVNATKSQVIYE